MHVVTAIGELFQKARVALATVAERPTSTDGAGRRVVARLQTKLAFASVSRVAVALELALGDAAESEALEAVRARLRVVAVRHGMRRLRAATGGEREYGDEENEAHTLTVGRIDAG